MAYSELVKNFNRIRDYMRQFYVFGFKSRDEYTKKSARSYDDERRRLESWLGDAMRFRQTADGKTVFISIDSRAARHNPLYKAWKAKSFTDGDITLHFLLIDILTSAKEGATLSEITHEIDARLSAFAAPRVFDESTVRKKLREYAQEGIVTARKDGKTVRYSRAAELALPPADVLDFYSEAAPCGVVGSFLLDKIGAHKAHFSFKHHYITDALDSDVLCSLFMAIREKRSVEMVCVNRRRNDRIAEKQVIPLKVMVSVQSGRQYLMAYTPRARRIMSFRLDAIVSVKIGEVSPRFDELRAVLDGMLPHMWGVSTQSFSGERMEHVEFTVRYSDDERYIMERLEREKRCGFVEHLENNRSRFTADVYDAAELVPWIRTFICRIETVHFSDKNLEARFLSELNEMFAMYGLEGGDGHALQ